MENYRWRVRFAKREELRYISHLDLYRTLTRILRRAGIPLAYSHGYNPRLKITLGPPLALGLTSEAEYFDLELVKPVEETELFSKLRVQLPKGMEIIEIHTLPPDSKSLLSGINVDEYLIFLYPENLNLKKREEIEIRIKNFLAAREIPVTRYSKTGVKIVDLKQFVLVLEIQEWVEKNYSLRLLLKIGPAGAIKPSEVLEALFPESPSIYLAADIKRISLYLDIDGRRLNPMAICRGERLVIE